MEEDIKHLKDIKEDFEYSLQHRASLTNEEYLNTHRKILAIENILNELERLQKENEKLISDNLEYQRIQDIFDKRTYRKKYLEERRKETPNLLYPDSDEIYKRYYELKEENKKLKEKHKITCELNVGLLENTKECIPKQVIRDKIYKLKNEFDFFAGREHAEWQDGEFDGEVCDDLALQIKVLKELLGEN